jgi:ribulose-5-phosphate 4-epimerase/fuculose-1-phosphate aldolase
MNLKKQIIKFSKKLNSTNLSALRSGNISARA